MSQSPPPICDYEGSNYRTEFWEGKGRDYEDRVERIALRRLLPRQGRRALEIGAGFGRLSDEFGAYQQVVVLDYSFSQLQHAQAHHGRSDHFVYVAADAYQLPFQRGVFDAATMIRVIHHMADVAAVLREVRRVITPGGAFILEHANKRNLKALLRYALKRQTWNPNALEPVEFVELNFDFHPEYIRRSLGEAGFNVHSRHPVSFFRLPLLKERVPVSLLAAADGVLQHTNLLYAPSVFIKAEATGDSPNNLHLTDIFACPVCGGSLTRSGDVLTCGSDGLRWAVRDGIYDFKAPIRGGVMDRIKNLGEKSRAWLAEIGITTFEEIENLGSVEVYKRLKAHRPREITLNMLYGLEAALIGIHWLDLPPEIKDDLKRQANV